MASFPELLDVGIMGNCRHGQSGLCIKAGVRTNIHYVLNKSTVHEAVERLKAHGFPEGINAIVFLLHKPVGLGKKENIITADHRGFNGCSVWQFQEKPLTRLDLIRAQYQH